MLLVCAVLKTLHLEKGFITEEECRRVSRARGVWLYELAFTIALKPPGVVKWVMNALEEYEGEKWYGWTVKRIKGEHTVLHLNSM